MLHGAAVRGGHGAPLGGCFVLVSLLLGMGRDAWACGATPAELELLLPTSGASNVPLNAVLITSSNLNVARMELREVMAEESAGSAAAADAGAGADAGASASVALDIECDDGPYGGAVCLGRPREALQANTRYEWRGVLFNSDPAFVNDFQPSEWQAFTTGNERDDAPIEAAAVTIRIIGEHRSSEAESTPCGITHSANLGYALAGREPAVINFRGYTPQYVMHATQLTAGIETRRVLYNPPDCLAPELYDPAGHRTVLGPLCLTSATLPAQAASADGGPPTPAAASDGAGVPDEGERAREGCAISEPPNPGTRWTGAALGALALAVTLARRRFGNPHGPA